MDLVPIKIMRIGHILIINQVNNKEIGLWEMYARFVITVNYMIHLMITMDTDHTKFVRAAGSNLAMMISRVKSKDRTNGEQTGLMMAANGFRRSEHNRQIRR